MKLNNFRELLIFKTGANLRIEISQYYLNYLWWVINPLMSMMIFYIVFGIFLNRGTKDFVPFLLCGITSWQWFANTVNNASASILNGKGLMQQVDIHKVFFPLEVILSNSFKHIFALTLLLVFLVCYPIQISIHWLALPLLLAIQFIINTAFALLCAAIVPFIPDLRFVINTVLQLVFFASGIFFPIERVILPKHRILIYMNPMAGLIKNYRSILLDSSWPDWTYLLYIVLGGAVLLVFSVWVIHRLNRLYPRIC